MITDYFPLPHLCIVDVADSGEKVHPSWEASRKRKEQQTGSLQAFQGKKVKFDD